MITRRPLPGESVEMYSPIGLKPIDTFTGKAPLGRLRVILDLQDELGQWRETDIKETRTPGDVIAFPALGRSAFTTVPERKYRVRIEAEYYMPFYTKTIPGGTIDGIEFKVFPYNDAIPPKIYPKDSAGIPYLSQVFRELLLVPAPNYPFPAQIMVLRGRVVNNLNQPIVGATVSWRVTEATLSAGGDVKLPGATAHKSGEFCLPIRPTHADHLTMPQEIDAFDPRSNKSTKLTNVIFPKAVKSNQELKIPTP